MIYIWDNGGSYSDHEIDFVESDLPEADVRAFIEAASQSGYSRDARILGVAQRVEWLDPGKPTPLYQWAWVNASFFGPEHARRETPSELWEQTPPAVLDHLAACWVAKGPDPHQWLESRRQQFLAEYERRKQTG